MGQALAIVPFDHLNDIQFRPGDDPGPASFTAIFGGEQLFDYLGIGSKTIDSDQDRLNDTPRGLTHLRYDLQDQMLVPIQRYSTPNEQTGKHAKGCTDPGRLSLQLDPYLVGLHLGQLDCLAADKLILNPHGMVTGLQLPTGHRALVDLHRSSMPKANTIAASGQPWHRRARTNMTIGNGYFKFAIGVPYRSEKVRRQLQHRYRRSLRECTLIRVSVIQYGH